MNTLNQYSKSRIFFFVRHGEALKNVEDRHGGMGTALTDRGRNQMASLSDYFNKRLRHIKDVGLIAQTVPQVSQSATIIGQKLSITPCWDERLRGIDLGVLAGLSKSEVESKYPEAAVRMEEWRQGKRRMNQLYIPGAETAHQFETRVRESLRDMATGTPYSHVIVVCTRSVLIMLINIAKRGGKIDYEYYSPYDFEPASISELTFSNNSFHLVCQNETDYSKLEKRGTSRYCAKG